MIRSAGGEEGAEEGAAVGFQHAPADVDAMVEPGIAYDIPERGNCSGLGVVGAEDQPANPREHQSPGAHRAGLKGYYKGVVGQSPGAEGPRGPAEDEQFGVRGGILGTLPLVSGSRHDGVRAVEEDGADGYVVMLRGSLGFSQGEPHCGLPPVGHASSGEGRFGHLAELRPDLDLVCDLDQHLVTAEVKVVDERAHIEVADAEVGKNA